jgi:hypoxanthine-DNA glycosylase
MDEILHSMAPIIEADSRVLILGTMPSTISLQMREYYANPRNHFWSIMYAIYGTTPNTKPSLNYQEKLALLKQNQIGLWDVLKECERYGSGDPDIKNGALNDFSGFLATHPSIKCVCFNGQKASKLFFRKYDEKTFTSVKFFILPSTSPANAGVPFSEKVEAWRVIRKCTGNPT